MEILRKNENASEEKGSKRGENVLSPFSKVLAVTPSQLDEILNGHLTRSPLEFACFSPFSFRTLFFLSLLFFPLLPFFPALLSVCSPSKTCVGPSIVLNPMNNPLSPFLLPRLLILLNLFPVPSHLICFVAASSETEYYPALRCVSVRIARFRSLCLYSRELNSQDSLLQVLYEPSTQYYGVLSD